MGKAHGEWATRGEEQIVIARAKRARPVLGFGSSLIAYSLKLNWPMP
ncbi:MAG: hypothetical protein PHN49_07700 [Candidatus Omnitrophica bacterium]|nr:hypothetical protein [Candidatus Omnitrophota bacterium]